jgi:hypothetical protein
MKKIHLQLVGLFFLAVVGIWMYFHCNSQRKIEVRRAQDWQDKQTKLERIIGPMIAANLALEKKKKDAEWEKVMEKTGQRQRDLEKEIKATADAPQRDLEKEKAAADACALARAKVNELLRISLLSMDIAVNDSSSVRKQRAEVTVTVKLISEDGKKSFADGSLQVQVYPTIKRAYAQSLKDYGFDYPSITVETDFKP